MSKAIGPKFKREIAAAGLTTVAFSWTPSGEITFAPSVSQEARAAVLAVYEAHDPEAPDIRDQIEQLERDNPVTPRALREFIIGVCQASAIDMNSTVGLQRVAQLEAQIVALRAQL